ncbi:MAG: DUF4402 domain-containing protein [Bacteroidetes bacterium]|nr:DUF4402 domain-containing protein [Bacteroidota bacterium]
MKTLNSKKIFFELFFLTIILFTYVNFSFSQPVLPQRTITAIATQAIHFGTFCVTGGSGGTVTVGFDGSRTSTGNIVLLSDIPTAQPAIFQIKLCEGRSVIITFSPTTILNGSNGGNLTLDIGDTEKGGYGAAFPTNNDCNFITPLRVGGTLHVPGTALSGTYSGSFTMTFNQE